MERNSSATGKLLIGTSYEFEYLQNVYNGSSPAPNPSDERTTSSIFSIYLSYSITDNMSVEGIFPWRNIVNAKNNIDFDGDIPTGLYERKSNGFSDALLIYKYSDFFLDDAVMVTFGGGVKLATGSITATDDYENILSETLQVGSGALDPVLSLFIGYPNNKWLFSGNFFTRLSAHENIVGYKYGNEFHTRVSINYDKTDNLFLKLGLESVFTERDTHQYGEPEIERGGFWLYAVPGFGIRFSTKILLDVEIPWTAYLYVNESQLAPESFFRFNLLYDWSLND